MVPTSRQMGGGACSSIPFNLSVSLHRRNRTGTRSSVGAARALTRCAARADGSKTFIFSLVGTIPPPGAAEVDEIGPSCRSSRPPFARGGASPVLLGCGCSPPCHVDFTGCPHGSSSTSAALGACGASRGMLRLSLNVVSRRAIRSNLGRSPPARIRRLRSERRPISAPPP